MVGTDGETGGREQRQQELVAGRERRASDVALTLARNMESAERLSRGVPELDIAVRDLCALVRDGAAAHRRDLESAVGLAEKFLSIMTEASRAANEFKSIEAKVREVTAVGVFNADDNIALVTQLRAMEEVFQKIDKKINNINDSLENAGSKAGLDSWLRGPSG